MPKETDCRRSPRLASKQAVRENKSKRNNGAPKRKNTVAKKQDLEAYAFGK